MGGGYHSVQYLIPDGGGLSPHGRGILGLLRTASADTRPIPAWAGDTRSTIGMAAPETAYPRMGGGYRVSYTSPGNLRGLSPHGRGIRFLATAHGSRVGPIPAWAGDTARSSCKSMSLTAYPRMGGGYTERASSALMTMGLSPHGRGIRKPPSPPEHHQGPIPAWAGDTTRKNLLLFAMWAYPRMGGGYAS